MPEILCPVCNQPIRISVTSCACAKGHKFTMKNNIIDFLPNIDDETLKEEEKHGINTRKKGRRVLNLTHI